jgi:hypothetical protein
MRRVLGIASLSALALTITTSEPAAAAFGFCVQPTAPTAFLRKPTKPFCAADRNCDRWEVDNYQNEIDRYFRSLKAYLADVDSYRDDAYAYAKCMAELD